MLKKIQSNPHSNLHAFSQGTRFFPGEKIRKQSTMRDIVYAFNAKEYVQSTKYNGNWRVVVAIYTQIKLR